MLHSAKPVHPDPAMAERNFRAIFDGVEEALIIHTAHGEVIDVNRQMLELFGISPEQATRFLLHHEYSSPHDSAEQLLSLWASALAGETQRFTWQARRPSDGVEIEVNVVSRCVPLNGVPVILSELRDRSVPKAAETLQLSESSYREKSIALERALLELRQAQLQLVQSEKMSSLGQLVAGVAHEINNPVNFIYGNLTYAMQYTQELLTLLRCYQDEYPEPLPRVQAALEELDLEFLMDDMPRLLTSMKVGADRIRDIVRSLRNFSRLDEAEFKPVNLHDGLDSTLMILQNRLKPKPHLPSITVVKRYGNLPLVECYAGQLNQVFMNILTNAIDALEERDLKRTCDECLQAPSTITIMTKIVSAQSRSPSDSCVQIQIADNGAGISEVVQQRLFDPFFTTKAVGKGTGLGMSISQQIVVEKHRGKLWCHSNPETGTEFVIQIPVKQSA